MSGISLIKTLRSGFGGFRFKKRREGCLAVAIVWHVAMVFDETARAEGFQDLFPGGAANSTTAFDWSGAYIGLNAGAGRPLHGADVLHGAGVSAPLLTLYPGCGERTGFVGGVQAGYLWQIGPFAYGAETEINYLGGLGGANGAFLVSSPTVSNAYTLSYSQSAEYFGSLRLRFGVTLDRLLLYGTLGSATGGTRGAANLTFVGMPAMSYAAGQSGSTGTKYVAGLGIEYAFSDMMSARMEYAFLNDARSTQYFTSKTLPSFYVSRIDAAENMWRFGVNHLFGDQSRAKSRTYAGTSLGAGEELYSVHVQETNIAQGYLPFRAPYTGPKSFPPGGEARNGSTTDFFIGMRLWPGAEIYANPEINSGYALGPNTGNVTGAASYPNAAFTRGTSGASYLRFMRYFVRQYIGLGGDPADGPATEQLDPSAGTIARRVDKNRITVTAGKYAVNDIFDTNNYAHDPTHDFLNFNFSNALGSFDYASDSWGYTYGATVEWQQNWWTARAGIFQLPLTPGSSQIEPVICRQCMVVGEFESRYEFFGEPGVLKLRTYGDSGYIADISQINNISLATGVFPPNPAWLRSKHVKTGIGINISQQIAPNIGFFLRAGATNGKYESISYTDVDKVIAGGFVFSGNLWGLKRDEIGLGLSNAGLSPSRATFFYLGGSGLQIGNSTLTYGNERVIETYYRHAITDLLEGTLDYQFMQNPAYDKVRGPVNFFGLRLRVSL